MNKIAILTISDRCFSKEREDETGKVIESVIKSMPVEVIAKDIVPDEREIIVEKLLRYCDHLQAELILTNGGTGFSPRDITPEATREVIQREVPGLPEIMRFEGSKMTPKAYLSRAIAGIRGETLIINLPGSPKGAEESLRSVLPVLSHAMDMLHGKDHF